MGINPAAVSIRSFSSFQMAEVTAPTGRLAARVTGSPRPESPALPGWSGLAYDLVEACGQLPPEITP